MKKWKKKFLPKSEEEEAEERKATKKGWNAGEKALCTVSSLHGCAYAHAHTGIRAHHPVENWGTPCFIK